MEIRYMNPGDDRLEISSVYEQSWKAAYKDIIPKTYLDSIPQGRWADSINREGMNNLVLVENGKIIGTSCFCSSRWEKYKNCGEIVSIYLLPEFFGKGYGSPLFERVVDELGKAGYEQILLWVLEENVRAIRFYEHHGFVCGGEVMNDNIGGKDLREILYKKTVSR